MNSIDYLIRFHPEMLTECDRCGMLELHMEKLNKPYQRTELVNICSKCAPKANSFLNYYGIKKQKDINKLMEYIVNTNHQQNKMIAMMNAGYF